MTINKPVTIHTLLSYAAVILVFMYLAGSLLLNNFGVDGTCYAAIARNMAIGLGTPWKPIYSITQHNPFFEHPSLGLVIYSAFFSFFGDKPYTEHIYATLITALTLGILFLLWRALYLKKERRPPTFDDVWILIICWFSIPYLVFYTISGGLELLADLFAMPSIYLLFKSCQARISVIKCQLLIALSALCLFLAFMINGPLTLFPLSFYLLYWFTYRENTLSHYCKLTSLLITYSFIIACLFFYLLPEALDNFSQYWHQAVNKTLMGQRYDAKGSGFYHFKALISFIEQFKYYLVSLVLLFIILYLKDKKTISLLIDKHFVGNKEALLFFLVSMSATLPISVSPKQSLYYTQQGGFFLVLSCCSIITPLVKTLMGKSTLPIKLNKNLLRGLTAVLILSMSAMPSFLTYVANHIYDQYRLAISPADFRRHYQDSLAISKIVPKNGTITYSLLKATTNPEPIGNQLIRHFNISLTHHLGAPYSLVHKSSYDKHSKYRKIIATLNQKYGYKKVNIDLQFFYLYTRV